MPENAGFALITRHVDYKSPVIKKSDYTLITDLITGLFRAVAMKNRFCNQRNQSLKEQLLIRETLRAITRLKHLIGVLNRKPWILITGAQNA